VLLHAETRKRTFKGVVSLNPAPLAISKHEHGSARDKGKDKEKKRKMGDQEITEVRTKKAKINTDLGEPLNQDERKQQGADDDDDDNDKDGNDGKQEEHSFIPL
jgi:hypothetical protein